MPEGIGMPGEGWGIKGRNEGFTVGEPAFVWENIDRNFTTYLNYFVFTQDEIKSCFLYKKKEKKEKPKTKQPWEAFHLVPEVKEGLHRTRILLNKSGAIRSRVRAELPLIRRELIFGISRIRPE